MRFKNLKRILVGSMLFVTCISLNVANAANEIDVLKSENDACVEYAVDSTVSPRADQIITKFRVYNDILQYRRWNATKGYWVDPDWIDVP